MRRIHAVSDCGIGARGRAPCRAAVCRREQGGKLFGASAAGNVEAGAQLFERAFGVVQFVEAEEPDAEGAEIGTFVALQGDAGSDLQAGGERLLAALQFGVGGVADDHARGLEAFGGDARVTARDEQLAHPPAEFFLFRAQPFKP